ncbi:hypothetical protein V6N11_052661 [Hibiscus sabdariffa]|uniref:Retrovirus-related Pol polyprotein from transposon TNT 1-94-like beta-barrel domain-containing protein n=1 Tax=Hibiscus sabdariffa TaxID=183260 RepID=A0ABR2UB04_9ROSI
MTWLINSMIPTIGKTFLLYPSTAEIWNAARETYSSTNNIVELYRIKDQATALKQDSMPITLYYNTLTAYWQQLDLYENHDWADPKDTAQYQKIKTQRRVFQFLQGLNNNLDDVRGRVLATSPLPSIREAFATVKKEASRRSVMLSEDSIGTSEGSTLLTNLSSSSTRKGRPWCEYCKKSGHTKDKCWKLHGKPLDWKSKANRDDKPFPTLANTVTSFTKEQLADLQKLFENFQGPYESNLVLASPEGNTHQDFFSSQMNTEWILDSGAIDHMTGNKALFTSFFPYYGKTVKTADESLCNIAGRGSVFLNAQLSLHNVLFVPSLACNLISVSKLSQDLNCSVVFDVSQYTVQALNPTKMIGKARLQNELYTLPSIPQTNISSSFTALGKFDNIMLWHFRENGIVHISSNVATLQQNGIAEHKNRHLLDVTRSLMFATNVPKFSWGEALLTNLDTNKSKLDPKSLKCVLVDLGPTAENENKHNKSISTALDEFPIAIRKGVRECTKHPLKKIVGYGSLKPSFQALTVAINKEQIPSRIDKALLNPKWRRTVEEKLCALEKKCHMDCDRSPSRKKGCWV